MSLAARHLTATYPSRLIASVMRNFYLHFLIFGSIYCFNGAKAETIVVEVSALSGFYYINDERQATLNVETGNTYILTGFSAWHPVGLSLTKDGKWGGGDLYKENVTATASSVSIKITPTTPNLFYYCEYHPDMGGAINVLPIPIPMQN
ncbi:hypothetical protein N9Z31_05540 [Pseudomonadales bacterium]|nr:hypothetical protein [Pseudomonadales bacterium]